MRLQYKTIDVILRDEFLMEDFNIVRLPPVDFTKISKGAIENKDIESLLPWLQKFLIHMSGNDESKRIFQKIAFVMLVDLFEHSTVMLQYFNSCFGAALA